MLSTTTPSFKQANLNKSEYLQVKVIYCLRPSSNKTAHTSNLNSTHRSRFGTYQIITACDKIIHTDSVKLFE